MPLQILRAVFDCNIFIQALLNPKGIAGQCLDAVRNKKVELYLSKATLDEIRDVILRPNILARLPDATTEQIEVFIENIITRKKSSARLFLLCLSIRKMKFCASPTVSNTVCRQLSGRKISRGRTASPKNWKAELFG
jgi:putative PIN family toxin of toxin-antitoxin system